MAGSAAESASDRRVAFVSGASRGIGRATALALAEKGFACVLAARSVTGREVHEYSPDRRRSLRRAMPGSLEETAAALRERGREALVLRLDLLDAASVEAAADAALAAYGAIDLLVNNAIYQGPGIMDRVLDTDPARLEDILRGNVTSQLRLVQRLLPPMLERGRGAIVNLVSAAGMSDPPVPPERGGWGFAYGASKAALLRMAGCLAVEHAGSGVSFFNLEPGLILTESMRVQGLTEDLLASVGGGAPPELPAAVIAWLATDPGAAAWHGKTVHAQPLAKQLGLTPVAAR
jgi:NAD(P)-dependent dehydrogenase (short-subunit alcohol dehydrogenase family)